MTFQKSPCPVCRAMDATPVSSRDRKGEPLRTVLCEGCGHVFNDPVPSASELAEFYGRSYRVAYKGAARPRMRQIARNFERVQGFWSRWGHMLRNHRRVLDVGAGSGEFLFFAQGLGYEASGVEPNVGYSAFCRDELGLAARTASIEDLQASEGVYDFIRLNHVVEHLRDPVEALEKIAERLAPDGVIYVEVPNILHYANAKSKGGIFHYGHISNFSPWT
ncbi:MAG: methyltransferase domain-containing protein, partial [Beijerinckiaceae bacterium]|nr:methyltransferase domain-containing protein [Beijerinckiaceae bacterium]